MKIGSKQWLIIHIHPTGVLGVVNAEIFGAASKNL